MSRGRLIAVVVAVTALTVGGCAEPGGPTGRKADSASAQRDTGSAQGGPGSARPAAGSAPPRARSPQPEAGAAPRETGSVQRRASTQAKVRSGRSHATALRQGGRRFWVKDKRRYRSPWYAGAHRRMINFGCTPAPYYSPDPRCTRRRGFHHGLDIAMPCGTRLFSALRGRVVDPGSAGSLGSAYGRNAFRIRNQRFDVDIVIGHTRKVFVRPGQRVRRGQLIARASDMGAPDGCHLHFEVRPKRGSVSDALHPRPRLRLRAID